MKQSGQSNQPVLLLGTHPIAGSIANCLVQGGWTVLDDLDGALPEDIRMAILVTEEDSDTKMHLIREAEECVPVETLICINTETIGLDTLQEHALHPGRIISLNWTEPADSTFFLEIIANDVTHPSHAGYIADIARATWNKDPYVIHGNTGIRMRLMGALIREALFLVGNGYANVEDVDRACRNDAGYYLPFAGNLRYMDLMGTYAYGMVMKELNRELARDTELPLFFKEMIVNKEWGMDAGKGFYSYAPGEAAKWRDLSGKFSHEISELITKYHHAEEAVLNLRNGAH